MSELGKWMPHHLLRPQVDDVVLKWFQEYTGAARETSLRVLCVRVLNSVAWKGPGGSLQLVFSGAPYGRAEGCEPGPVCGTGDPGVTLTQASRVDGLLPACGVCP